MAIKDLSINAVVHDDDRFPIYDVESGRTRSVLASTILKYIDDHPATDKFVQSGSYAAGTLTLTYNDGGSIAITGFETGTVTSVNNKTGVVVIDSEDVNAEPLRASGTIDQNQDPTTMPQGDYYVQQKFLNSPDLPSGVSYVGPLRIDEDFDGSNNGALIQYFTSDGQYTKRKLSGGWDTDWKKVGPTTAKYRTIANFSSTSTQNPTGTGDSGKIKMTFGGGGSSPDGELTTAASGITTFHKGFIQYSFRLVMRIGRAGATGESIVVTRFMYASDGVEANAVQVGPSSVTMLDNQRAIWPEIFTFNFEPAEGSIMWIEIARDEAGDNSGGLLTEQPSGSMASWASSHSASINFEVLELS